MGLGKTDPKKGKRPKGGIKGDRVKELWALKECRGVCGKIWDRDRNAARNIMAAFRGVLEEAAAGRPERRPLHLRREGYAAKEGTYNVHQPRQAKKLRDMNKKEKKARAKKRDKEVERKMRAFARLAMERAEQGGQAWAGAAPALAPAGVEEAAAGQVV